MSEKKLKLSKYTRDIIYEDNLIIYNLLNEKKAICNDPSELEIFNRLKTGEEINIEEISKEMQVFCTEISIDETKIALGLLQSNFWNKHQINFIVLPTMNCMLNCKYCYEEKNNIIIDSNFMDDFYNAIINYHNENQITSIGIEWYGGEPLLLYDKIISFTQKLNKFCNEKNIRHTYSMTTNGFLLTYDRAEQLIAEGINSFQITLDGMSNTHDSLRPQKNGTGSWHTITNNLIALKKSTLNFNVMIRVNYNEEVLIDLPEFHEFILNNFDNRFTIFYHVISKWGGENDENLNVIDPGTSQYIDNVLVEEAVNSGLKPKMHFDFANNCGRVCYANRPYFYILSYDRKLRKCTFTDEKHDCVNVVGNLIPNSFKFDYNKLFNFIIPDYKLMYEKGCFDCSILPICQGLTCALRRVENHCLDCAAEKINIDNIIIQEYRYYRLLKEKT